MLRLVVTVCLVALVAGGGGGDYKMKQYAHMKIQKSCFGEEYVTGWYDKMKASSKKCSTEPQLITTDELEFQDVIDEIRNMALPWGSRSEEAALSQTFQLVSGRSKRHVSQQTHKHTTAEKLYHLKEKTAAMVGNMTCMLRDIGCLKMDNTPDFDYYANEIDSWTGPADLKEELKWGLDVCKDFSMCISPQRARSPFMKRLGHYISFAKCMEMKKMMACMKHDMKEYLIKDGKDGVAELIGSGLLMGMKDNKPEKMGLNALSATMSGDLIF